MDEAWATVAHGAIAVRPSPLLVRIAAAVTIGGLLVIAWAALLVPVLALAAVILALALIDWRISRRDPAPKIERVLPQRLVKDRPVKIVYQLSYPGPAPTRVSLLDELPTDLGGDLLIDDVEVKPGQPLELARELVPKARGLREIGTTNVLWRSRLGLLQLRARASGAGTVAILPSSVKAVKRKGLIQKSVSEELGLRPRPARGEGSEFESLRDYMEGDDPRHVDWHASARRHHLIVRQYQTERRHTVFVAIDSGRLMAARVDAVSKLDHAINCAVALARASIEYGDRVGLIAFDRELRAMVQPKAGPGGVGQIIEATLKLGPHPFEPNYRILVEALTRHQKKRALIVVLTDFVEGSASSELQSYVALLTRHHCVMLVALRDRLLAELDQREPAITRDRLYRRLALQDVAVQRAAGLGRIRRFGAHTLDLDPAAVTAPVLNRYFAIRQAGLL
jgi:uncharacterized protein (DUF58 family)